MKNSNKKENKIENSTIVISATLSETYILKRIVEEVASSRFDSGYCNQKVQFGWEALETSSLEADAIGHLNFFEKNNFTSMPFETCFLFTCIKGKGGNYQLNWGSSLS